ncbi:MAG: glycosyltransferase family 2 protein [Bacteroidota bacterium]
MASESIDISIVVPLYNEEQAFPLLVERLNKLIDAVVYPIEIVLVNDGSSDATPILMKQIALTNAQYQCVFLSRNYGHQIALTAGMSVARGRKAVMVIDGDLQDPPELLPQFYQKIKEGYDVVYGIRKKRKEGLFKRTAYYFFYRLLKKIAGIDLPLDSGDFGMMSRRVVDIMNQMPEQSRYLRGMRAWVGFNQVGVAYERSERVAGSPKYNFRMLLKLAYNGIFNFSDVPIKILTRLGLLAILSSLCYFTYSVIAKYTTDTVPTGFTALLFVIILFGGVQLISIGILGEYIIRMFFQVKNRPIFIIKEKVVNKKLVSTSQADKISIIEQ